jgi:hypothetical protein
MSETPAPHDDFAEALAGLRPSPPQLDRDQLMYQAGRSDAGRRLRRWQCATGLTTAAAACLALTLLVRPEPDPVIRIVQVPAPAVPVVKPVPPPAPPEGVAPVESPTKPDLPLGRFEQAVQAALEDAPPPSLPDRTPPLRHRVASAWEWHTTIALHPSILEERE